MGVFSLRERLTTGVRLPTHSRKILSVRSSGNGSFEASLGSHAVSADIRMATEWPTICSSR